jgi:hypothetical protein
MQISLNNDLKGLFYSTRRLLEGAVPYRDYVEVNPPFITLLLVLPYSLSQWLHTPLPDTYYACVIALILLSLMTANRLIRATLLTPWQQAVAISAMAVALLTTSFISGVFADREHLLMVLIAPWLVLFAPLPAAAPLPRAWRITAACLAAIGFAIKPYFYVFFVTTTAYSLWRTRAWRSLISIENAIVCAVALAYLAITFVFFSDYVFTVIPIGLQTYAFLGWSSDSKADIIKNILLRVYAPTCLVAVIALRLAAPAQYASWINYLLLLLLACIASYVLNGGWWYCQYPFISLSFFLAITGGATLIKATGQLKSPLKAACIPLLIFIGISYGLNRSFISPSYQAIRWDILSEKKSGHPLSTVDLPAATQAELDSYLSRYPRFMMLTTHYFSINLIARDDTLKNASRFDFLWPLPGLVYMQTLPEKHEAAQKVYDYLANSLAEDLERNQPQVVIIDISTYQRNMPPYFALLPYFLKNPAFAKSWQSYEHADTFKYCLPPQVSNCAYDIYLRKP